MFKKFVLLIVAPFFLYGGELQLVQGSVHAHTEVFGDSSIEPYAEKIYATFAMEEPVTSLRGEVFFQVLDFVSDKQSRDESMHEAMEHTKYDKVVFTLSELIQEKEKYYAKGLLALHGVQKEINIPVTVEQKDEQLTLNATFSIKMSEYGITPPTLLFLTVRDEVDIRVALQLQRM
ncbi:MAG: YceI family protein [Campylobacterales bacterium]|nr:YceI family protein [Campylobacterales bacterium]